MSDTAANRELTFFDRYSRREVPAAAIDDYVDRWHDCVDPWAKDMPLHDYLGLTWLEYQAWVNDASALPRLRAARARAAA